MEKIIIARAPAWDKKDILPTTDPLVVLTHENEGRIKTLQFSSHPLTHETFFPHLFFPILRGYHNYNFQIRMHDGNTNTPCRDWSFKELFRKPSKDIYLKLVELSRENALESAIDYARTAMKEGTIRYSIFQITPIKL